jgi:hypothetical protein
VIEGSAASSFDSPAQMFAVARCDERKQLWDQTPS